MFYHRTEGLDIGSDQLSLWPFLSACLLLSSHVEALTFSLLCAVGSSALWGGTWSLRYVFTLAMTSHCKVGRGAKSMSAAITESVLSATLQVLGIMMQCIPGERCMGGVWRVGG